MNNMLKNLVIWLVIGLVLMTVFNQFNTRQTAQAPMEYSQFLEEVKSGRITKVTIEGRQLKATTTEGKRVTSYSPGDIWLVSDLLKYGVKVEAKPEEEPSLLMNIFVSWFPMLLLIGVWIFFMRQMQGGGRGGAFSFGKSRARMLDESTNTVTFADVAGCDEAKEDVAELVDFLRDPTKFQKLGGRIPKGVLMVGSPGTGKTLLARAIAGEAKVPFFSISGSDFVEMFVGVGAARVRDMFEQAKKHSPCIVFIDEIDAVGRQRGAGLGGGNDEREQTLNQLLVEMDGFEATAGVIVIAATNRPDVLDPALLRPGRFDRQVILPRPDSAGRRAILQVHAKGKPLGKDVDLDVLAKQTWGLSGADLANVLNEGAILTARRDKKTIGMGELEEAIDRVVAGPERKSRVVTARDKRLTAYHEGGHALVSRYLEHHDPVHKITIVTRGMSAGATRYLPPEDRGLWTKSQFQARLATALGGRAAEMAVYGEVSTGSEDDISQATNLARSMVKEYGMSEKLGPVALGNKQQLAFLGRSIGETSNYSKKTTELIDSEVRRFVDTALKTADAIIVEHRAQLDLFVEHLIQAETLTGEALERAFVESLPVPATS